MSTSRACAWAATAGLVVTACATTVRVPEIPILDDSVPFKEARREPEKKPPVRIVEVPKPLPLPGQLKPVPEKKAKAKDEKPPKERVTEANALAKIEPAKDGYINAIQVYPYTKGALYQLYAAPAQVTDIALEPGEKLVSVSAGDTVRWVVGDTTSGAGKAAQVHILVKPIGANLETNLVITTDRRTYHLEMHASQSTYMASVSWTYPASELLALKKQRAEADGGPHRGGTPEAGRAPPAATDGGLATFSALRAADRALALAGGDADLIGATISATDQTRKLTFLKSGPEKEVYNRMRSRRRPRPIS
jgi:type IV secretion system protein VirB9